MRNLWKYSFWTLLFIVCATFFALLEIGILKVDFPTSQDSSVDVLRKRSIAEDDGRIGESSFPANVVGGSINDNDRFEREYEYNTSTDDDDDDVTIVDDASSADGGSTDGEDDDDVDKNNKDDKKDEDKDSKKDGETKKDDKKNVLSEEDLLKYHSKAISKIWAPNIERNLV